MKKKVYERKVYEKKVYEKNKMLRKKSLKKARNFEKKILVSKFLNTFENC